MTDVERATEQPPLHPGPADAAATATATTRARTSSARRDPPRRPATRRARSPSRASTRPAPRTRPSSGPSPGSRSPTARAASTSTSPPSGCTSTAPRSRPASALPPEQVRVHLAGVGGAFGGREDISMQIHAALLALHTGRPVKMVYSREESFTGHVHRHPSRIWARHTRDARRAARQRPHADPARRRRLRLELDRRLLERGLLRLRALRGPERAARGDRALHQQPALRGDAGLRRRPDLLRRRGPDGQARRARSASTRSSCGSRNALAPGDTLPTGQRIEGSLPTAEVIRRAAALDPARARARCPRDPLRAARRRRQHDPGRGRPPRQRLRGRLQEHLLLGGLRRLLRRPGAALGRRLAPRSHCAAAELGQGVTDVILAGRARRARHRRRLARAALDGDGRLGRLDLGLAADLDGLRRRPRRLPGGARRARGATAAATSTSSASTATARPARSTPRPAR